MSETRTYNSRLRQEQAEATRERIVEAMAAILAEDGRIEAATNRAVAQRAGVTDVTVYRHFPSRELLLRALWEHLNRRNGANVGMPEGEAELVGNIAPLFATFDAAPAHITAAVTSEHGREMRGSLDPVRREAFLDAIAQAAAGLSPAEQAKAAGVIQLLHSAYAWLSLREQWNVTGQDAADAAGWAIETLLADLRARGSAPLKPRDQGPSPATDQSK
ncbi:TetR/AcrR family transcriptional regulator [Phenylobacterium sp.]|uniref:TetR/AcrR family transcriptional regulator n=1 Tax=Phenylobacterium sp. TaxID=1871053 RepID=UPI0035B3C043